MVVKRDAERVPVTGWWRVLDLGLLVLSGVVLVMSVASLFRDDLPRWWVLSVVGMVLVGSLVRRVIDRHRRRLVHG